MRAFPPQYQLQEADVLYFSHIPKTAGMTFRTIVEDHFHCHEICPATLDEHIASIPPEQLKQYRLFRGHLGFIDLPKLVPGKRLINVNILREPVARVISHYDYIRRTPTDPRYDSIKDISLEEFAEKLTLGKFGKNMQTYRVAKVAQFNLNDLSPEETLELAKQSLDQFAFAGILEKFQDSLFLLSYIFGWKPILNTRKENASKKPKTEAELSAQTLAVIREQTQLDQVLYQYAQEIFDDRFAQMKIALTERYGSESENSLVALLEKHAEHRYTELQIPPAHTLTYQFCQPLRGTGWQRREFPDANTVFRWTGDTVATIDLPLAIDQDLQIEFCIINVLEADVLQSLTLEVGGMAGSSRYLQGVALSVLYSFDTTIILQGTLPRSALTKPFTHLTFKINRTLSPRDLNPNEPDTRSVGLAFTSITAFPVNSDNSGGTAAFLFSSPSWSETVSFIEQHLQPGQQILAPTISRNSFLIMFLPIAVPYLA
ncbi:MAG: sulfotransferase family protein [Leptolyngbyaceae cyanobacterium CSU_1_4]|nr:sulfotransferase family protein [Leptolyngbyaceae cyanobacterium CSU_1_4]